MIVNAIAHVEALWRALFEQGGIPRRSDIDPKEIGDALEFAFVVEARRCGTARLRVAGAHLNDLMGMEVRGMPFAALCTGQARSTMAEVIDTVVRGHVLADLELQSRQGDGAGRLDCRMFLAPLRGETGQIDRLLGCAQSRGIIGRPPRRFDISGRNFRDLHEPRPVQSATLRQIAHADASQPTELKDMRRKGAGAHLRLVHSAD